MAEAEPEDLNILPITVEGFKVSEDGETIILEVHDKLGKTAHLGLRWKNLPGALALLQAGAEAAKRVRRAAGGSDSIGHEEEHTAFVVADYEAGTSADGGLGLLSLHCANGLRFDFAIPGDARDAAGGPLAEAIGRSLIDGRRGKPPRRH